MLLLGLFDKAHSQSSPLLAADILEQECFNLAVETHA